MPDILGSIKSLAQDFQHLSFQECLQALSELYDNVKSLGEDVPPEMGKAVLTLVLSIAAPRCTDRRELQWYCLQLVGSIGRASLVSADGANRSDLHGFFCKLVKKEAKSQRMWKPKVMVPMLQNVRRFFASSDLKQAPFEGDGSCSFDAVSGMMQALYGEMGRSEKWEKKWRVKASRCLTKVLSLCPKMLEHAVGMTKKEDPPSLLVAAVSSCVVRAGADCSYRTELVEHYGKCVLEAKQPIMDCSLDSWGPILGMVQPEEFEKQLLPVAGRMLKRNPAAILVSFPSLVTHVKIDLAPFLKDILDPMALECMKAQERRARGRLMIQKAVSRCSSTAAPTALIDSWMDAYKKAGKTDEKQAILMALGFLVQSFSQFGGDAGLCKLADPKGDLVKVASTEANEDTRSLACRALGAVLLQIPSDASEPVAQELSKQLVDKKATDKVKTAVLECLSEASAKTVEGGPPWLTTTIERVLPFVGLGATKPGLRLQSLIAWSVIGSLARQLQEKVGSALKKEHLAFLKDGPSFLNSVPTVLKAPAAELVSQAQLWGSLLSGCVSGLAPPFAGKALSEDNLHFPPTSFSEAPPVCRTAVVLLAALHGSATSQGEERPPEPLQRLGLIAAVKALPEAESSCLVDAMVQVLASWIADLSPLPSDGRVSASVLRETLIDLCEATAAAPPSKGSIRLALIALIAHHPMLTTRTWSGKKIWKWLRTEGPLRDIMKSTPADLWHLMTTAVCNASKLPANDKTGFRQAAVSLTGSFDMGMEVPEKERASMIQEINRLVDYCGQHLHSEEMSKEKANNITIYFAQEGRLWREEGTYVAEERVDINQVNKKNKFLKGLYDGDDDLIVEKPKPAPPKAASKSSSKAKAKPGAKAAGGVGARGGPSGAMTGDEIEAANIAEQSETRARIRLYLDETMFVLAVLETLASSAANTPILEVALPDIVPKFLVLLKCPLAALQSRRSLRALAQVIVSPADVNRADVLADALQVVAKTWMMRSPSAAGTSGDTRVCEVLLDAVATTTPMPTAAMSLVLPVILRLLFHSSSQLQDVCAKALSVLEKQLRVGATLPSNSIVEVFESLSIALIALPGQRAAMQAALSAASQYLVSTGDELQQLANMFFSEDDGVRSTVITAISNMKDNENFLEDKLDASACRAVLRLGALDEKTAELAASSLEELFLESDQELLQELIGFSQKSNLGLSLQNLVALAIAQVLQELEDPDATMSALDELMQLFRSEAASRTAVARCLEQVFKSCLQDEDHVLKAFKFLLRQALGITSSGTPEAIELRDLLLAGGMSLIEKHGEEHVEILLSAVEEFEDSGASTAAGESARLGVAVFLGALSKHLPADHPKVPEILPRLLQRLLEPDNTISVQNAIVKVMPPLMKQNKEQATETLENLLEKALAEKTHEVARRGAAMGLGATVKGLSIQAVSKHEVLVKIEAAVKNTKQVGVRQGALMCLEGLTLSLGRLFDPYAVTSLPFLLQAFSDPDKKVQAASQQASKAMMSQLGGPGVKQVLKPLLEGIKDKQWKTKLGSIELLAAMTSCLPKELAKCLPQVVPALCGVINDQHNKVKEAGREALDRIGNIITSPELRALAPNLIEALTDGAQYEHITKRVLDQLLATSFVHHIDAPSLSLVCPLVQRALKDRSAEMKRKGAQIVGSMVLLIKDAKDIQPYLPGLLPQLKVTLVDPSPDVRATTAKAFGTLANGLPEDMMGDVLPWLFDMLRSSESNVERGGAAHGLSEVLMAMGIERIEMLLPDILNNASNKDQPPEVKEGYLGLFVYLPVAMGDAFKPYLSNVLETLLGGLADDSQDVRETALRAAQEITKRFGASYTALLLPPLEEGVFDPDWRIRHASVQLMGQLIEQILRANRIPIHNAELMSCEALPKEWRAHMLASLYIVRSDEHMQVRNSCSTVWKAVVQNTPRTLKELLPALMKRLIANLASTNREKQRVAARCVGDLVSKLGERVMPELMPIFMSTLSTGDAHVREGVCIGLAELINATTKQMLADYLTDLIPAIRQAIIDDVDTVRNSASVVVALLQDKAGARATTDVVTWVLAQLSDPDVEDHGHLFLNGLEQLISKQPGAVLPIVLKNLTEEPEDGWTVLQIQGLAVVAAVPDTHTVHQKLSDVLPVFIRVAGDTDSSEEMQKAALESAGKVMDRVEQGGLEMLFAELSTAVEDSSDSRRRAAGMSLLEKFFQTTQLDVVPILPMVLPAVLPAALADEDEGVLAAGVRTLNGILKKCTKETLAPFQQTVREIVLQLVTNPETKKEDPSILLPGLSKHSGIEPLFPIYQQGLMYGNAEGRELAAKGLGELVNHTTMEGLKPYVVKITGPLIRIVGDRFPSTVKIAIVDTLKAILVNGGPTLKPFLPQLQTTYVKLLEDPSETVRQKAGDSLGMLVRIAARTDALIKDLLQGIEGKPDPNTGIVKKPDPAAAVSMFIALGIVLMRVPAAVTEEQRERLQGFLLPRVLGTHHEPPADAGRSAGVALAMLLRRHLPTEASVEVLQGDIAAGLPDSSAGTPGPAWTLAAACRRDDQDGQLKDMDAELSSVLKKLVQEHGSKLASNADAVVKEAASELKKTASQL